MKKRLISLLLAVGMMLSLFQVSAFAEGAAGPTTKEVSTPEEFKRAVEEINDADSGSFVISLKANIELPGDEDITLSKNTTTILGNGHTLSGGNTQTLGLKDSAVLNLGSETVSDTLTLDGNNNKPGIAAVRVSGLAALNLYDDVTIENYTDSGVRVGAGATFEMHGGTIQKCSSTENGGGVAVKGDRGDKVTNTIFTMSGGTIQGCSAGNNGGGVYVDEAAFTMSDGRINNCSAGTGGGVYIGDAVLTMSGGMIDGCKASTMGGGIASAAFSAGSTMNLENGTIINNSAENGVGGGIMVVDKCEVSKAMNMTITGNNAATGGGICLMPLSDGRTMVSIDFSDPTNVLCNNRASAYAGDVFLSSAIDAIKLPAASKMNQNYDTTSHKIDNWYVEQYGKPYTPSENGTVQDVTDMVQGPIALVASYKRVRHTITVRAADTYKAVAKNADRQIIHDSLEDEKVYLSYDASGLSENETFEGWNVTAAGGASVKVKQDANGYYFKMPESDVTVALDIRSAGEEPVTPAEPSGPADVTGSIVAGAALGAAGYYAGTGLYLNTVFGYVPTNRQALASALWEKAGKPEPQSMALYTDVDEQDTDAQKADRWCVEQGLLPDKGEDTFKPAGWVTHTRCIVSWKKLEKMLKESAA